MHAIVPHSRVIVQRRWKRSAEKQLKEQLKFETLLSEVSAGFVNLPDDQIDRAIQDTQRRVCEFLGVDLSALWQLSMENPGLHLSDPPLSASGGAPRFPIEWRQRNIFPGTCSSFPKAR